MMVRYNLTHIVGSLVNLILFSLTVTNCAIIMPTSKLPLNNERNESLFKDLLIEDCGNLYDTESGFKRRSEILETSNKKDNSLKSLVNCPAVSNESFELDITSDGYLKVASFDNESSTIYYPPTHFCAASQNEAKICQSHNTPVVWRKCCPENHMLSRTLQKTCILSTMQFRPKVNDDFYPFITKSSNGITNKINLTCPAGQFLKRLSSNICSSRFITRRRRESVFSLLWELGSGESQEDLVSSYCQHCKFQLLPNGSISYEEEIGIFLRKTRWKTVDLSADQYCIDGVINPDPLLNFDSNTPASTTTVASLSELANSHRSFLQDDYYAAYKDGSNSQRIEDKKGQYENHQNPSEMSTVAVYICLPFENDAIDEINNKNVATKTILLAVLWGLTCPLLFCAALGNLFIIQRNIHGWILSCYLLSMCFLNILSVLVIVNVGRESSSGGSSSTITTINNDYGEEQEKEESLKGGKEMELSGCHPIDFAIKFTYMSTLCWMTSINFGLWKTFRYTLPQPVGLRRFIASVLFSHVFPLLSVTVSYYMAYLGSDHGCEVEYCLLFSYSTIPFFQVPMFILVFGNFAIFLKTSWRIARLRQEAAEILQRQAQDHLKSFTLFTKLFLLTGSIWLIRLVLFVLQVHGLYLSLYGIFLEMIFSIPEIVFPMIIFHHPEFIRWCWRRVPNVSSLIYRFNPFFKTTNGNKYSLQMSGCQFIQTC